MLPGRAIRAGMATRGEAAHCPVCETQAFSEASRCEGCGLPTALFDDAAAALQTLRNESPSGPGSEGSARPSEAEERLAREAWQAEMSQLAQTLQEFQTVAQGLDVDPSPIASTLAQTALEASRGPSEEALTSLRSAVASTEKEIRQKLEGYRKDLERREEQLREMGLRADFVKEMATANAQAARGELRAAAETLRAAEESLHRLEQDWQNFRDVMARLEDLLGVAGHLGLPAETAEQRLREMREQLSSSSVSPRDLPSYSATMSAELVQLHERIRDLIRDAVRRGPMPANTEGVDPERLQELEGCWKQILRHSRSGRVKEAGEELARYRELLETLRPRPEEPAPSPPDLSPPPRPVSPPETPSSPAPASEPFSLPALLEEARRLASGVKEAKLNGREYRVAAATLRDATLLLKQQRLREAHSALLRVRRALTEAGP